MKTTLSKKLNSIAEQATKIIRKHLKESNGEIVIDTLEKALGGFAEVSEEFKDKTCLINQDTGNKEWEDLYLLKISGNQHDCELVFCSEFGQEEEFELFELSLESRADIADFLTLLTLNKNGK